MPYAPGDDVGLPVFTDYGAPLAFVGKLHAVTPDVNGELIKDDEMTMRKIMARQ